MDAGCPGFPDAGSDAGTCSSRFNFETNVQGAVVAPSGAFQSVTTVSAPSYCGNALAITASFSGTSGANTRGEVTIDLTAAADMDFSGKTITVHVAASPVPGCSTDLGFAFVLRPTAAADVVVLPTVRPVTANWMTRRVVLTNLDAGTSLSSIRQLSLQAFSSTGYQGTIYIDEIDIR